MLAAMNKQTKTAGTIRRAAGRARLMSLSSESVEMPQEQREIERLRAYLLDWSWRQKEYGPSLGIAGSCLEQYMKSSSPTALELFSKSDGWAALVVETAMDDLIEEANGVLMRAALRVRYLNEGIAPGEGFKIRVFRHGRLLGLSLMECDDARRPCREDVDSNSEKKGLPL
jgi:hypothetical protein